MDSRTIRVMLVDDHQVVRSGIALLLDIEPDLEVVAEAADGVEAVELARSAQPDVILMDIEMPRMDGVEATAQITSRTSAKVLMMTTFSEDEDVLRCLQAGASGFLLKNIEPDVLVAAIHAAAAGHASLSPEVTRPLITRGIHGGGSRRTMASDHRDAVDHLTSREQEVLGHVAAGLSNQEIADRLFLGAATVKTHVSACLSKLHLRDRVQLVVFAHESGFVAEASSERD